MTCERATSFELLYIHLNFTQTNQKPTETHTQTRTRVCKHRRDIYRSALLNGPVTLVILYVQRQPHTRLLTAYSHMPTHRLMQCPCVSECLSPSLIKTANLRD
uniref:Uncharacterized protein n=1 Tax=Anguilla anguilla TaxID=7936 RepID=A0A0E9WS99_ANGAN